MMTFFRDKDFSGARFGVINLERNALHLGVGAGLAIAGGISAVSGLLGGKNKTSKRNLQPATLDSKALRPTANAYQGVVTDYLKSQPGLTAAELEAAQRRQNQGITGAQKAQDMKVKSAGARGSYSGPAVAANIAKNAQSAMEARANAEFSRILAQHTIRESDTTRRAAVGAQFLWPAESARGAGQITSVSDNNSSAWLDAIGAGTAAFGQFSGGFAQKAPNQSDGPPPGGYAGRGGFL